MTVYSITRHWVSCDSCGAAVPIGNGLAMAPPWERRRYGKHWCGRCPEPNIAPEHAAPSDPQPAAAGSGAPAGESQEVGA